MSTGARRMGPPLPADFIRTVVPEHGFGNVKSPDPTASPIPSISGDEKNRHQPFGNQPSVGKRLFERPEGEAHSVQRRF
jgi:hypothetical protein